MGLLSDADDAIRDAQHEKELQDKVEEERKAEAEQQQKVEAEHEKNRKEKGTI